MKILDLLFWSKVAIGGDNDCWEWQGAISRLGYGRVQRRALGEFTFQAHRYAYYLKHGKWPINQACHTCNNRKCVNPAHVYDGTNLQNQLDRKKSGTAAKKLTVDAVKDIRSKYLEQKAYAKKYGVSVSTVQRVQYKELWSHVE